MCLYQLKPLPMTCRYNHVSRAQLLLPAKPRSPCLAAHSSATRACSNSFANQCAGCMAVALPGLFSTMDDYRSGWVSMSSWLWQFIFVNLTGLRITMETQLWICLQGYFQKGLQWRSKIPSKCGQHHALGWRPGPDGRK